MTAALPSPSAATLDMLARLVGFDTVSRNSNLAMIGYAADYLRDLGARAEVVPSPAGDKASLWATIGPDVDGGVILSGHSDVVPVDGQDWSSDPFRLDIRDGRAFGRGSTDMKGFIACALAAAPAFAAAKLKRPVHIALTYDEEIGCIGAPKLLAWLADQRPRPAIAFIGEPTEMRVVNAHKGVATASTRIWGAEAHSSLSHKGVSAIHLAARAIALLEDMERELAATHANARFMPSTTTLAVNRIEGGTAVNIMAGQVRFDWGIRAVPGVCADHVVAEFERRLEREIIAPLHARFPTVRAQTEIASNAPPLSAEPEGAAEALAKRLLDTNEAHAVPYGAEAGQFQEHGFSAIIVGPGSIEQAHRPDEFIALCQLARCEAFMARLGAYLSG